MAFPIKNVKYPLNATRIHKYIMPHFPFIGWQRKKLIKHMVIDDENLRVEKNEKLYY